MCTTSRTETGFCWWFTVYRVYNTVTQNRFCVVVHSRCDLWLGCLAPEQAPTPQVGGGWPLVEGGGPLVEGGGPLMKSGHHLTAASTNSVALIVIGLGRRLRTCRKIFYQFPRVCNSFSWLCACAHAADFFYQFPRVFKYFFPGSAHVHIPQILLPVPNVFFK